MESPLESFCIACARFQAGDRLGELFAVAATAPYFAIISTALFFYARREMHMALTLMGLLVTAALSTAIKNSLKHPRPAATCALLGNCHKHGMPSSHSAVMAFAATTCLLLHLHRRRCASSAPGSTPAQKKQRQLGSSSKRKDLADRLAHAVQLLEVQVLMLLTAAVAVGRIYLGYHSIGQVAAGLALGATVAAVWWRITLAVCQRWAAPLLHLAPLRALHIRDTLGCANVHAREAALFAGGSGAAAGHAD